MVLCSTDAVFSVGQLKYHIANNSSLSITINVIQFRVKIIFYGMMMECKP